MAEATAAAHEEADQLKKFHLTREMMRGLSGITATDVARWV